ncbi:MAG TPA: hypothetical protein VFK27_03900, partial [Bacillales bacterium]|nr:hypothetical protein [Bacillales bacterium]
MGVDFPEYIRITSAEKPSYWYADKMGEVFKVTGDASEVGSGYWVHYQGFDDVHTVAKEDCEPITKHEGRYYREIKRKAREGELIKIVAPFEASDYSIGYIAQVYASSFDGIVFFKDTLGDPNSAYLHEYLVLEPIAPSQP